MKKSAIALAVAAALGMSAAPQAETILYGSARVSVDYIDVEPAVGDDSSAWEIVNNSSRLGVRGAEDLGNGLSAIYQYEFGVDVTGGGNYFNSNRPRWVGLKGGFGAVTLGTQWTPFYNVLGVTDVLNSGKSFDYYLAGDSAILGLGDAGLDRGIAELRTANSIIYKTPDLLGLTAEAMLSMDGDSDDPVEGTEDSDPNSIDRWEANLKYENGPIFAGLAYIQEEQTDDEQWGAALGYLGDNFGVVGTYQLYLPEDKADALIAPGPVPGSLAIVRNAKDDLAVYTIQGNVSFGNNIAYATYAYTDPDASDFDEIQHIELGLEHYFSERTRIWAEGIYAFNEADAANSDDAEALVVSLGVRHDF